MNSYLANMRWLAVPSDSLGRDWFAKTQELDARLSLEGMDLAEESVYLLFSETPADILEGKGLCLVARSVIGPKKNVEAPLKLIDWVAAPVWRKEVSGESWEDILEKSFELHQEALKGSKKLAKSFGLCIRRKLIPELVTEVDVLFNE